MTLLTHIIYRYLANVTPLIGQPPNRLNFHFTAFLTQCVLKGSLAGNMCYKGWLKKNVTRSKLKTVITKEPYVRRGCPSYSS